MMIDGSRCGRQMKRGRICGRKAGHGTQCRSIDWLQSEAASRERDIQSSRQFYRSIHGRAYTLVNSAKQRALAKNLPFDLTVDWAEINLRLALDARCPLLGIAITLDADISNPPGSPSIDRKNPARGYVQDNCWIVSHRANSMKRDATQSELLTFAANVIQIFGSPD